MFLLGECIISGGEECNVMAGEWIISGRGVHVIGWGVYHFRPGGVHCFWLGNRLFQARECIVSGWGVNCDGPESALLRVGECKRCFKLGTAFFKA
jgi:hypothetical protein